MTIYVNQYWLVKLADQETDLTPSYSKSVTL